MPKHRDNTESSGFFRQEDDGSLTPLPLEEPSGHGSNGAGRRENDPSTAFGFAWRIAERWGFPAVMCGLMAWWIWFQATGYQSATMQTHEAFRSVMQEQTTALKEMTSEQRATNKELVELGGKIDEHLRERRGR